MIRAYYNEIEPFAVERLKSLIARGLITPGDVDERSILDVSPTDLIGYDRCHFFAGIAGWERALQLAGWPEDRPVWTGSCPCQPFSSAGKGARGADERHLWPAWFHLIRVCRPPVIFGEQVASKDGLKWLDLVCSDLEAEGYAVGAADLCAAGVGAPHIRQRLWFVAVSDRSRCEGNGLQPIQRGWNTEGQNLCITRPSPTGLVGHAGDQGLEEQRSLRGASPEEGGGNEGQTIERAGAPAGPLADAELHGHGGQEGDEAIQGSDRTQGGLSERGDSGLCRPDNTRTDIPLRLRSRESVQPGSTLPEMRSNSGGDGDISFWFSCTWLPCRDGKWRPTGAVEPGVPAVADGLPPGLAGLELSHWERTPHASDGEGGVMEIMPGKAGHYKLRDYAQLAGLAGWPTPNAGPQNDRDTKWEERRKVCKERHGNNGFGMTVGMAAQLTCESLEPNIIRPLATGVKNRVGKLKAVGNAIVPQVAAEFIKAYLEVDGKTGDGGQANDPTRG